jgi:hypothetical protein
MYISPIQALFWKVWHCEGLYDKRSKRSNHAEGVQWDHLPKDLLPGAKVEPTVGDRHDDLAAHHAQLGELRSASGGRRRCPCTPSRTGLTGAVVTVAADRLVGVWRSLLRTSSRPPGIVRNLQIAHNP